MLNIWGNISESKILFPATRFEVYTMPSIVYVILPTTDPFKIGACILSFRVISGIRSDIFWVVNTFISFSARISNVCVVLSDKVISNCFKTWVESNTVFS